MEKIKIKKLAKDFVIPTYATSNSAAVDLRAHFNTWLNGNKIPVIKDDYQGKIQLDDLDENSIISIKPGQRAMIPLGFSIELPEGKALHISARSGLALKNGIIVVNAPGIVDADYRGSVNVIIHNLGGKELVISNGDRICQGSIVDAPQYDFELVNELTETDRGEGGFGHSGVK